MPKVHWTEHAKERAAERSGHPLRRLSRRIEARIRKGEFYQPSEELRLRSSGDLSEKWVVADGPKGKATAIVVDAPDGYRVITIRDSEVCEQGEYHLRGDGNFPFEQLLAGHPLAKESP